MLRTVRLVRLPAAAALAAGGLSTACRLDRQHAAAGCEAEAPAGWNFPVEQLYRPAVPYPGWDPNWDEQAPTTDSEKAALKVATRHHCMRAHAPPAPGRRRRAGTPSHVRRLSRPLTVRAGCWLQASPSRHIILIRHGQYDETSKDDHLRVLTPLGRAQAEATGRRLAALAAAGVTNDAPWPGGAATLMRSPGSHPPSTCKHTHTVLPPPNPTQPNPHTFPPATLTHTHSHSHAHTHAHTQSHTHTRALVSCR